MKKISFLLVFGAIAVSTFNPMLKAQADSHESEEVTDMASVTCRDLLLTDGDDREQALTFFHGYINGKKGVTTIDSQALSAATDQILETCIDNPSKLVLSAFEEHR